MDGDSALTVESYDPVGRITYLWQCTPYNCPGGTLWDMHYSYTPGGEVDTYVHPAGYYIGYGVGNDGRIDAINSGLNDGTHPQQLAEISYAPQGAAREIANGCAGTGCSRSVELNDYNNRLELVRSRLGTSSNPTSMNCVVYNNYASVANATTCAVPSQGTGDDGNVLGKFDQDNANASLSHTASLAYDATHRLTSAVAAGSSTYNLAFSYDRFGNMTCSQNQQTQGLCPQYSFSGSTNRITNTGYAYDASGDLTNDGAHTYQYDAEGRMVSVDNGTTASYVYNALGERVEKDVGGSYTEYVFDKDGNPLGENNRTSWVDTWVDFQGQHIAHYENNETYFIHSNQVGTAGMVTDYSGAVIQDELHYPWGQEWTMAGGMTEERFASLHHRDAATNLDPTHFRMYSSDMGRWMRPDPAGRWSANPRYPQTWNRYGYTLGNPTNRVDPFGLQSGPNSPWFPGNQNHSYGAGGFSFANGWAVAEQTIGSVNSALQAVGSAASNFAQYGYAGLQVVSGIAGLASAEACEVCAYAGGLALVSGLSTLTGNNNTAAATGAAASSVDLVTSLAGQDWLGATSAAGDLTNNINDLFNIRGNDAGEGKSDCNWWDDNCC